jgi:hypothetical protein
MGELTGKGGRRKSPKRLIKIGEIEYRGYAGYFTIR